MKASKQIAYHYQKAGDIALAEVERMARAILVKYTNLHTFSIGMGSWGFVTQNGDHVALPFENVPKYMYPLRDFIDEWDTRLYLTGQYMKFTATSPKITD